MRKTLVDRLAERITEPAEGDLLAMVQRECTMVDELAEMDEGLRVWAEADSAA